MATKKASNPAKIQISIKGHKRNLFLEITEYTESKSTALMIIDRRGEYYCDGTVWIHGLGKDEVAIKEYETAGVLQALIDAGIISKPVRYAEAGMVTVPVCKLIK